MPLDVLLDAITREGEAEAKRVVDEARARATQLRAAADARSAQQCAAAVALKERELRYAVDATCAVARADAQRLALQARLGFLERVFSAVEAALPGHLDQVDAVAALEQLLREARAYFPGESVRVRCRPGLAARLGSGHRDRMEIVPDESVPEGVIVETLDRRARIENTLIARMRRLRRVVSVELVTAVRETS